jgi:hypothetical protein
MSADGARNLSAVGSGAFGAWGKGISGAKAGESAAKALLKAVLKDRLSDDYVAAGLKAHGERRGVGRAAREGDGQEELNSAIEADRFAADRLNHCRTINAPGWRP